MLSVSALPVAGEGLPAREIAVERLPDLNRPRSGCVMALGTGGEPVVFGGHTTGFVLTQTAEYFADGAWHEIDMLYPHDFACCVSLRSGNVLLGGGVSEAFGVGRSWGVEEYDPELHSFTARPILDIRRALCSAAELEDGTLVVSGNWYADDAIGVCPPGGVFDHAADVAEPLSHPFILQTGPSDALIFGSFGTYGDPSRGLVSRLSGGAVDVPLLREWKPAQTLDDGFSEAACRIGEYTYLLVGTRPDGACAVILVREGSFSLLPLSAEIPVTGEKDRLVWAGQVYADSRTRQAWLFGYDRTSKALYLLRVGYGDALDGGAAPVTFYRLGPLEGVHVPAAHAVLPDGSLLFAGGMSDDNYNPAAAVYRLLPDGQEPWMSAEENHHAWLLGLLCGILTGVVAILAGFFIRRRSRPVPGRAAEDPEVRPADDALMVRITALMEERQLFRRPGLTLQDVAQELGSNTRYVSTCINDETGKSFPDYINSYRVKFAQRLLKSNPGRPLSGVAEESGFSSESSFFRNCKALTGKTPNQWLMER